MAGEFHILPSGAGRLNIRTVNGALNIFTPDESLLLLPGQAGVFGPGQQAEIVRVDDPATTKKNRRKSRAIPVVDQIQSLSAGKNFTVKAACGSISKRECARLAKPVNVEVLSCTPGWSCHLIGPQYGISPADGAGASITLSITLSNSALHFRDFVRVVYGDGEDFTTDWEPVIPAKNPRYCCQFRLPEIWADLPVAVQPFLTAVDSQGNSRIIHSLGRSETRRGPHYGWWRFEVPPSPEDAVQAGDTVTIQAIIDGGPIELATGTIPSGGFAAAPLPVMGAPGAAPVVMPAASGASIEPPFWVPNTGNCRPPEVEEPLNQDAHTVTVDLFCSQKDISKLVLYRDNKPQLHVSWRQVGLLRYEAYLPEPLKAFELIKVLQFDAQMTPNSIPKRVNTQNPRPLAMAWWMPTPGSSECRFV
jgi:hypothetical protein